MPNKKKLYEALKAEGYDNFADESSFNAYVDNADNRKKLFSALKQEGYDNFADETEFEKYLGYNSEDNAVFEANAERFRNGQPIERVTTQSVIDANPELELGAQPYQYKPEVQKHILQNKPDMFKPKQSLMDSPLGVNAPESSDEKFQARINVAQKNLQDTEYQKGRVKSEFRVLSDSVDADLEKIEDAITSRQKAVRNIDWKPGMPSSRDDAKLSELRGQRTYLEGAKELIEDSQNILNAVEAEKDGSFFGGLGRGVRDKAFDIDTWTMGLSDLVGGLRLKSVLEKAEKGENLTPAEEKLLDASVNNMAVNFYYRNDLGLGYQAGEITGQSIPFMLEFLVNPVSASGNAMAKRLLTYGLKRFGSTVNSKAIKAGTRLATDALAAGGVTATTGMGNVLSGGVERLNRNYEYGLDEEGNLNVANTHNMGVGEAFAKSATSAFLERQSEMIFNAFRGAPSLFKGIETSLPGGVNTFMNYVSNSRLGELWRGIKNNATMNELAKRTQFHGLGEEYLEEVYNNFANIPLGEMTFEEATDLENNIVTFLGLAPTQVMFSAIGGIGYGVERYKAKRDLERTFGKMTEEQKRKLIELQEMGKLSTNKDIALFLAETIKDESLTPEQKRAEIEYAYNLAKQNAIDEVSNTDVEDSIESENQLIDAATDPQTGMYGEVMLTSQDLDGNNVVTPANVFGEKEVNGELYLLVLPEGETEKKWVRPNEYDANSYQKRPAEQVKALNEEMIREEAAKQAEQEAKYAPEVLNAQMQQGVPFNTPNAQIIPVAPMPEGNGWIVEEYALDTNNKVAKTPIVRELTNDEYRDMLQAQLNAEEAAQEQIEAEEQAAAPEVVEEVQPTEEVRPIVEGVANQPQAAQPKQPTLEEVVATLPKTNKGEIDYKAMTPQQQYQYTSITESPEVALEDLQADITAGQEEIVKKQEKLTKAKGGERAALRDEVRKLTQAQAELQSFYDSVAPKQEAVEETAQPVEEAVIEPTAQAEEAAQPQTEVTEEQVAEQPSEEMSAPEVATEQIEAEEQKEEETSEPAQTEPLQMKEGESALQFAERAAQENDRRTPLRKRAEEWSKALGVDVTIYESVDDIEDEAVRQQVMNLHNRKKLAPGWVTNGKVYFLMSDMVDMSEIDNTYVHEVVAHVGIEKLLGKERFAELCDKVWEMMPQAAKDYFYNYPGVDAINDSSKEGKIARQRKAADEYIAHLAEKEDLTPEEKTIWDNIVRAFREMLDKALNGIISKSKLTDADIADIVKASYANLKNKAETAPVTSVTEAAAQEKPSISFNVRTEAELQEKIRKFASSNEGKETGWTAEQIESIIEETSALIKALDATLRGNRFYDEFADREPTIRTDWRDGEAKPVVTWTRANIEYKYDMSADLLCINNDGMEAVLSSPKMAQLMKMLPTTPVKDASGKKYNLSLTSSDYLSLYAIMKDMGFVVPCKGCFDAAGRLKMLPSVAQKFAADVNSVVDERNKNPKKFDDELKKKAEKDKQKSVEGLPVTAKTKMDAIRSGVAGDNLIEHIDWTDLMTAEGQAKILAENGGIFRAWQRTGAGRPKDKLPAEPYIGDITSSTTTIIGAYGDKTPSFRDIYVNEGTGLRRNSHSELRPYLAVDEIQFMRDAFIRNLTVFKYMKELDDVRLFGKMGVKFNMSFFPEFVKGTKAAGLDINGDYIASEESVGAREFPYQGEDGKMHYDGMKGWAEAQKYVNEDVSLSSVVFSIPHLIKALTDVPTPSNKAGIWGSLIPFHSSGATTAQLAAQGLGNARANGVGHGFEEALTDYGRGVTNFEAVQNDRFQEGWVILAGKKKGEAVEPGHKLEFVNGTHYYNENLGVHLFPQGYALDSEIPVEERISINTKEGKAKYLHKFSVDYNEKVREIGTPTAYKEAADYYLDVLPKIGISPRFDFVVPENVFLQMCADVNVDPRHPKLGWKGEGNNWNPIDSEAYYSMFCDYGMTNPVTGEWASHRPVGYVNENGKREFRLPENTQEIVEAGVNRYTQVRNREDKMSDDAIRAFADEMVSQGRLNQDQVDKVLGETRFRFIGEKGARNLDKAEEATTRLDNLAVAREMEVAEKDAKTIKMATGWERGADGLWRYETSDGKVKEINVKLEEGYFGIPLTEVVDDKELFMAYPELENALFTVNQRANVPYASGTRITMPARYIVQEGYDEAALEQVIKEEKELAQTPEFIEFKDFYKSKPSAEEMKAYEESHPVVGKYKAISQRKSSLARKYGLTEGVLTPSVYGSDFIHELQHVIQYLEGFTSGANTSEGYDRYHRNAGEVEARNAATRMNMSEEDRRNTLAIETEDVARKDQIFLKDAFGVSEMGSRVRNRMKQVGRYFEGRTLTSNQQSIVDVFCGNANNKPISVVRPDGTTNKVVMRQGMEDKGGSKHSLLRHFDTHSGVYTEEEILLIEEVLSSGEETNSTRRGVDTTEYNLVVNGVEYTVVTETNNRGAEVFDNFYTNRSDNARSSNTQLSAQADSTIASADKDTANSSDMQEGKTSSRVKSFETANGELDKDGISINNKELMDEYGLSDITLSKSGNHVTLSKVVVEDKGKGNGTRFMEDLTNNADNNGWILALTPDTSFGGSSVARLKKFYKRFGFKDNKGRNTDFETRESMVRPVGGTRFRLSEKGKQIQAEVDKFTSKYNSKPVRIVESGMDDNELMAALDNAFELGDVKSFMKESKTTAGYFHNLDKIIIFADRTKVERMEEYLFHENIHAAIHHDNFANLVAYFYEYAKDEVVFEKWSKLAHNKEYKQYNASEEFLAYVVSNAMVARNLDDVAGYLGDKQKKALNKLFNVIGYDYDIRRRSDEQSVNGRTGEETSGESSLEGNELLNTGEGRGTGEGIGKGKNGKVSAAERKARLNELFNKVADMGLQGVLGNKEYTSLMVDIYKALPEEVRAEIAEDAIRLYGGSVAPAVSDYIGPKSKNSIMDKVVTIVREALRKIGFDLGLNANEVRYMAWRSKKPLDRNNMFEVAEDIDMKYRLKVGEYDGTTPDGGGTRFRTSEDVLNQIKQARKEVEKNPSEAQKEAGNYKKGHITLDGFEITLENPKGGTRSGVDKNGKKWSIAMNNDYGYIRGTEAVDGDHIDVFLSDNPTEGRVFVVDQSNEDGTFDESKVMYGFNSLDEARNAYLSNYEKGWEKRIMDITEVSKDGFKEWIDSSHKKTKAFSEYKSVKSESNDIRFRVANKLQVRDEYEATIKKGGYQAREAVQDAMLSLRKFQELIEKASGKKIRDFENAWMHENRLSSVVQAEIHDMERKFYKPMMDAVKKLMKVANLEQEQVADYLMLKHGIERNREMAVRKALTDDKGKIDRTRLEQWYQDKRNVRNRTATPHLDTWRKQQEELDNIALLYGADMSRDYSGLTSMFGTDDLADSTQKAYDEVEALENAHPVETESLGKNVKAMTQNTLDKSFESGLMDRKVYDELSKDMYDYYIPLRGFEETTSEEVYAYLDQDRGAFNAPLKRAKGRSSKSDNPIAYLKSIAESGIMQGNRNKMKQSFLNMVINNPSDLVSVREGVWVIYNPATGEWEAASAPAIPNNATPADVEAAMEAWEQQMEQAAQNDPNIKKVSEAADIPYRVVGNKMDQHQIIVKRLGKSYTLTVNGNPRLAMAINGQTNPNNTSNDGKVAAFVNNKIGALNRSLAAWYTTRNPDFVASNFMRDTFYTNTIVRAKEGNAYANKFHKNYATVLPKMLGLFRKYENGTLNPADQTEAAFLDFMMNGGETGYSNLKDVEEIKKQISKELKGNRFAKVEALAEKLDILNRAVENTARFAAYLTSREEGRSIAKSIFDAKEISVNFNKKGAGGTFFGMTGQTWFGNLAAMIGASGRALYVFFNAAIQGSTNLMHVMKVNPKGTSAGLAAMFLMGAVIPFLFDDDDDEKDYYDLPEHVRRNHLIIPGTGDAWISIPLPIEYRIMYGMGELLTSWRTGHERGSDIARKMLSMSGQALPLNFLEEGLEAFVPSSISPVYQVMTNSSWTGLPIYKENDFNKDDPEYTKAYSNVDRNLLKLTKALYEWSFDEENQKERIDLNPAIIETLAKGYFGGLATQLSNIAKVGGMIAGEQEFDWRNIPIGNIILKTGDERTKEKRVTNEYFENMEKLDFLQSRERMLKKTEKGVAVPEADKFKAQKDLETMQGTEVYKKYQEFKKQKKVVDKIRKTIKEKGSTPEREKQLMEAQEAANKSVR